VAQQLPTDDIVIDSPPLIRRGRSGIATLLPLFAIAATIGSIAVSWTSGGQSSHSPMALAFPSMMLMSAVGMLVNSAGRRAATELDDERRRYIDHLDTLSVQLRESAELQRESVEWAHPAPAALWTLVGTERMWMRCHGSSEFLRVRVGTNDQPLHRRIVVPQSMSNDVDPVAKSYLGRFAEVHSTVAGCPVTVRLGDIQSLRLGGDLDRVRHLFRSMICQLAVTHSPAEVAISVVVDDSSRTDWEWVKWLPHNRYPDPGDKAQRVVVIDTQEAGRGRSHAVIDAITLVVDADGVTLETEMDSMTIADARVCARRLARYQGYDATADSAQAWCRQLGLADLDQIAGENLWAAAQGESRLTVPIGLADSGEIVTLDIREAAEGGLGPHGICVGATGSGKSELLRTMVLGLAVRHSPAELNLILIDFKGGATFSGMERLRHVSAVITNLSAEAQLVARMKDALAGELHRRQELFRAVGNVTNIAEYRASRRDRPLPALASLLVVVDEFAELLQRDPEFIDLFTVICRVGRSLGVHLLLASQRLDEGRLRGLESFLSYRICLKTLSAAESRAVLGVPDAAELPATPGCALLRTSEGTQTRFRAFCLTTVQPRGHFGGTDGTPTVRRFVWEADSPPPQQAEHVSDRTVLQKIIEELADQGDYAHPVWIPPLLSSPSLAGLVGRPVDDCHDQQYASEKAADLFAPIGLIDLPFEQRRIPLVIDARGAGGNIAIVGAPQSGKSASVRTLVCALASRYSSRRIQFYCIDFGGGSLSSLRGLPHVGSVAKHSDRELIQRMLAEIQSLMSCRHDDVDGQWTDDYGDVFVVVDGLMAFRDEFVDADVWLNSIAARGLSVGVHLVLTANRWADLRSGLKDLIGTKIELRLGDPLDSEVDRKQAALVPVGMPGRGIDREGRHFVMALPESGPAIPNQWRAPGIRLLPKVIEMTDLEVADATAGITIGIGERELAPVSLDFDRHQHLLIFGDAESGKTSTLRALFRANARSTRPAQLFVVDYRRGLLDACDRFDSYAFSPSALATFMPQWLGHLEKRMAPAGASHEQLRTRSWWTGPEIFVVIDDYELVDDHLAGLVRLLPHARDIGLHLIIARRCGGAARAMYDPLLSQLREASCMGLLLSGSPDEGALFSDHRAAIQPPGRGLLITRRREQLVQIAWCASD
jgi:S-DNA-T family DNA segregation ATPase FtsK/SpoIIIE